MKYTGGCHCGNVAYEVETNLENVIECNCSHCSIKGLLLTFVPENQFSLLKGEDKQTVYHFNKHVIDHLFCSSCGVESFAKGSGNDGPMVAINVRALKDVDLAHITRTPYEGKDK